MLAKLRDGNKVVGTRRLVKALENGEVSVAYVAMDADLFISRKVADLCREKSVPIVEAPSMKALGEACGVEVPTAAAGLKR